MSKEGRFDVFQWTEWEDFTPLFDHDSILYYLDLETREILTTATKEPQTGVRLTPLELEMITILVESGGVKMSARVLREEIWPTSTPKNSASCARVYASRLKKRLEEVSPKLADNLEISLETSGWKGFLWKWKENPYTPDTDSVISHRSSQ